MNHTVFQFCQFPGVPSVGGADKISGDSLYSLKIHAAFRACRLILLCVFISALRAVIAIVIH